MYFSLMSSEAAMIICLADRRRCKVVSEPRAESRQDVRMARARIVNNQNVSGDVVTTINPYAWIRGVYIIITIRATQKQKKIP